MAATHLFPIKLRSSPTHSRLVVLQAGPLGLKGPSSYRHLDPNMELEGLIARPGALSGASVHATTEVPHCGSPAATPLQHAQRGTLGHSRLTNIVVPYHQFSCSIASARYWYCSYLGSYTIDVCLPRPGVLGSGCPRVCRSGCQCCQAEIISRLLHARLPRFVVGGTQIFHIKDKSLLAEI